MKKFIGYLLVVLVFAGGAALYGKLAYGDATCGFTHCVKVK